MPGEQRQQRQIGHHAPVRRAARRRNASVKAPPPAGAARPRLAKIKIGREDAHADGAQRHEADFHMASAQHLAQQRADAYAYREHHQQQRGHLLVAAQHLFREGREDRLRKTAPKNHIQLMPSSERKTTTLPCASTEVAPGFGEGVPVDLQAGVGGRRQRHRLRQRTPQCHGQRHAAYGHVPSGPDLRHRDQQPAGHLAQQDGHEGAHLHHAVAAGEFTLVQVLRQVGELHRPEKRAVQAHQKDAGQQHRHVLHCTKPQPASPMMAISSALDEADQAAPCCTCRPAGRWWPRTARKAG